MNKRKLFEIEEKVNALLREGVDLFRHWKEHNKKPTPDPHKPSPKPHKPPTNT